MWYIFITNSTLPIYEPHFNILRGSSRIGVIYLGCITALLAHLMSTQIKICSGFLGLGTTAIGDTHGVGPLTFSIMSNS